MRLLFIVPDGVGVKNYFHSNLIETLEEDFNIQIYTPLHKEVFTSKILPENIFKLSFEKESFITRFFRESSTVARLYYNAKLDDNPSILSNLKNNPLSIKQKLLYNFSLALGQWASKKYNRIVLLEKFALKGWNLKVLKKYEKELIKINPKKIFITHQRVSSLMPICLAAIKLNIPVYTVIFSWDNLPKARLNVLADKYLVWSSYMKGEMKKYYPEINQQQVIVTGTPQFEFYFQKNKIFDRVKFADKYKLNPSKTWICFSGDDKLTSPYDPEYLDDIATEIEQITINERPVIIFRRCPVDFSDRYDQVIFKHQETIKVIDPLWTVPRDLNSWGLYYPIKDDNVLLQNLAYHCHCVINVGSTMAHDFSIFDKPCLYLNYNPEKNKDWRIEEIYKFQHFRSMPNQNAVGWINNKEEIVKKILLAIKKPDEIGSSRKEWLKKVANHPLENASNNILSALKDEN
jgi:hypothetical protein